MITQAEIVVALIDNGKGRFLFQTRHADNPVMPNLWELPGGKKEKNETYLGGLEREIFEELGISGLNWKFLPTLSKSNSEEGISLHLYGAQCKRGLATSLSYGWFSTKEALRLPLPNLTRELISNLQF
ncbi:MAG: NUDIX domain-containing protein [Holophagaceae bacterium]